VLFLNWEFDGGFWNQWISLLLIVLQGFILFWFNPGEFFYFCWYLHMDSFCLLWLCWLWFWV